MVSYILLAGLLIAGAPGRADVPSDLFGLTVSASATDPWVTTSTATGGPRTLYLWSFSASEDSLRLHDFALIEAGITIQALRLTPGLEGGPGWWLLGPWHIVTWNYDACFFGPYLLGELDVVDNGGSICVDNYNRFSLCAEMCSGGAFRSSFYGFSSDGTPPCVYERSSVESCGSYPAVEATTWGQAKSSYRLW
jgi:hypothetical protein